MTTLTFNGRLPGVVCEAALPPRAESPLRLDVAAFVGFAERGPLNRPVPVEDIRQYQAVFGGDLPVARDGGRPVYARLPGAVRAFFDNGGRRCHVVRVAGANATVSRFRLPGVVAWNPDDRSLLPAIVDASSPGQWSRVMRIATGSRALPLRLVSRPAAAPGTPPPTMPELDLDIPTAATVRPGDLLRVRFDGARGPIGYFPVAAVERRGAPATTTRGIPVTVTSAVRRLPVWATNAASDLPAPETVERLGPGGWEQVAEPAASLLRLPDGTYALRLRGDAPVSGGDLLRLISSDGDAAMFGAMAAGWHVRDDALPDQPPELQLMTSSLSWELPVGADLGSPIAVERMRLDLYLREDAHTLTRREELAFGGGAGSWIAALAPPVDPPPPAPLLDPTRLALLRAPAAAISEPPPVYLPLGMGVLPGEFVRPLPEFTGSDGLDEYRPEDVFLDHTLRTTGARDLLNEADARFYLHTPPRTPTGIHGLLTLDEVGMIAVPDAVHRGWPASFTEPEFEPPPPPEPPLAENWSHFQNCPTPPPNPEPEPDDRRPCGPIFGLFRPDDAIDVPDIRQQLNALPSLKPAAGYDRVETDGRAAGQRPLDGLLAVHRALITLCAARADMLALLSLPEHFTTRETLDWERELSGTPAFRDGTALSYAAAYHPWVLSREEATPDLAPLRAAPPDGAVGGMIAARELARGPWIAPANVPLRGVVGLTPALTSGDWAALFDARLNVVRQGPGAFSLLSAHTLSGDRLLVHISVRRLLIFLRKLALRRGMRYVFESNNEQFRRRVQASFERTMTELAARGAITAFEVVTDATLNTPNDIDNGRFLIALKIAPTLPVEFITVVLLRSGEGLLDVLER